MRNGRPDYYDGNFFFPNFLAPDDLATIYDIAPLYSASTPIDGTGRSWLSSARPTFLADINDFRSGFGLSTIPTSGAAPATNVNGIIVSPAAPQYSITCYLAATRVFLSPATLANPIWTLSGRERSPVMPKSSLSMARPLAASMTPWCGHQSSSGPPLAPVVSMSYGICEARRLI